MAAGAAVPAITENATVAAPSKAKAGSPANDPASWILQGIIPSLRCSAAGEGGGELHYDEHGKSSHCEIRETSGYQLLDILTCDILMHRASFNPGTDELAQPVGDFIATGFVGQLKRQPKPICLRMNI